MSNGTMKSHMHSVLVDFTTSKLTATKVEQLIGHHMSALEKIGSRKVEAARKLSHRLVEASLAEGALGDCIGDEDPNVVLTDFHEFIDSLPD